MSQKIFEPGVAAGRLDADAYAAQFSDLHPPLDVHEALVAADRCYFCHDAPCIAACPTSSSAYTGGMACASPFQDIWVAPMPIAHAFSATELRVGAFPCSA